VLRFGLLINGIGPASMRLHFQAPGAAPIKPGEYVAEFQPYGYSGDEAYLRLEPLLPAREIPENKDEYSGRLRVWEYDGSNGTAIDFVLYRKTDGKVLPSVSGMLRSNSRYE
jgi:hypothetical protein